MVMVVFEQVDYKSVSLQSCPPLTPLDIRKAVYHVIVSNIFFGRSGQLQAQQRIPSPSQEKAP